MQDAGLSYLQDYCVLQVPFLRFAITASRVFYRIALKVLFHNESDTQKHNNGQAQRSGRRVRGCKERERVCVCVCVCVFVRDPGFDRVSFVGWSKFSTQPRTEQLFVVRNILCIESREGGEYEWVTVDGRSKVKTVKRFARSPRYLQPTQKGM